MCVVDFECLKFHVHRLIVVLSGIIIITILMRAIIVSIADLQSNTNLFTNVVTLPEGQCQAIRYV